MEEPASKKLLDKAIKEDNGVKDSVKEWEMSPASVSGTQLSILGENLCAVRMCSVRVEESRVCKSCQGASRDALSSLL